MDDRVFSIDKIPMWIAHVDYTCFYYQDLYGEVPYMERFRKWRVPRFMDGL